jgi:hypothetical protein
LVRSRRDVTADDNTRCIAAEFFASIHVRASNEPSSVANATCWCSRLLLTAACNAAFDGPLMTPTL